MVGACSTDWINQPGDSKPAHSYTRPLRHIRIHSGGWRRMVTLSMNISIRMNAKSIQSVAVQTIDRTWIDEAVDSKAETLRFLEGLK